MGASDRKVDLVGDRVDCVVRGGAITDLSLTARRVAELKLGVYASPNYLERAGTPVHPGELDGERHRIVRFRWSGSGNGFPYVLRRGTVELRLQGQHILSIDDGNAYLAAGLAGLGVLWLPDYMARQHVDDGRLVPLFVQWESDPMPLYIAYPQNRHISKALRAFIDWIVEIMAEHAPAWDEARHGV